MDNVFQVGDFDDGMLIGLIPDFTEQIEKQRDLQNGHIDLWITSNGGDWYMFRHLFELVEIAKREGVVVRTVVPAKAYSAGSMLAITGTPGHRYIGKGAEHLVHYGYISTGESTPMQTTRTGEWKDSAWKQIVKHYNDYCNIPDLTEHLKDDWFIIPAAKCKTWGLADQYVDKLEF